MYIGYNDTMRKYHQMIWVCPKILDLPPIDGKLDAENDDKTCVRKKTNLVVMKFRWVLQKNMEVSFLFASCQILNTFQYRKRPQKG